MRRSISEFPVIMEHNPKSPIAEAYRLLRTNLEYCSTDDKLKTIMVSSAFPKEGKTTTAINLAVAFAQKESKVLLIDADLRHPTLHQVFKKDNRRGLSGIIAGRYTFQETVESTRYENLSVLTSGPVSPNPSELLSSNRMKNLLLEIRDMYEIIIIDSPPVLAVTDASVIAAECDGVLMVIQSGKVKRQAVLEAKSRLDHVQANLLGAVLTHVKQKQSIEKSYYSSLT